MKKPPRPDLDFLRLTSHDGGNCMGVTEAAAQAIDYIEWLESEIET